MHRALATRSSLQRGKRDNLAWAGPQFTRCHTRPVVRMLSVICFVIGTMSRRFVAVCGSGDVGFVLQQRGMARIEEDQTHAHY
jgi:hypothetical protein